MRISDWSSDVCSSDLPVAGLHAGSDQALGDRGDLGQELGCGDIGPPAVGVAAEDDGVGEVACVGDHVIGQISRRGNRHGQRRGEFAHAGLLGRSEEHTSELQSLMRISYAVFCLKKKKTKYNNSTINHKKTTQ